MHATRLLREAAIVTALIVGAGAVGNSWTPVLRVLQPKFDFPLTEDGVNFHMARMIYLLRWFGADPANATEFDTLVRERADIQSDIADSLRAAATSGEIMARPELASVLDVFVNGQSNRLELVTTNWDEVVDKALPSHVRSGVTVGDPLHVHGSTSSGALYLPTEVITEPHRSKDEEAAFGRRHIAALSLLSEADRVIVYGLSLSPLDVELNQLLATGLQSSNLEEVVVVSPDHQLVAHRVNLLLFSARREVRVVGFRHDQLRCPHDYTVRRGTAHRAAETDFPAAKAP